MWGRIIGWLTGRPANSSRPMRTVVVGVPHQLGKVEARRRVSVAIKRYANQCAPWQSMAPMVRESGERLVFVDEGILGCIEIFEDRLEVQAEIPDSAFYPADRITASIANKVGKWVGTSSTAASRDATSTDV